MRKKLENFVSFSCKVTTLWLSLTMVIACGNLPEESGDRSPTTDSMPGGLHTIFPISEEQERALDALNTLQQNMNAQHLYSTVAGMHHACYPPDSSFVISRDSLLAVMQEILLLHCKSLSVEQWHELAVKAVLAQDEYIVKQCFGGAWQLINNEFKPVNTPKSGTWILPSVLGRRDVVLAW